MRPRPASNGMKAIILAAGEGKRMRPLTQTTPKPMLLVAGKPLLWHIINSLPEEIDEIILVTGHLQEQIKEYFGNDFEGRVIHYVEQKEKKGTGDAVFLCKSFFKTGERFLVLYADDLHSKEAIKKLLSYPLAILVQEIPDPRPFGVVTIDEHDHILEFIEKPEKPPSHLASIGVLLLDTRIFDYPLHQHPNGEYYVVDATAKMARDHKIKTVISDFWLPIAYPDDLKRAEKIFNEIKNA